PVVPDRSSPSMRLVPIDEIDASMPRDSLPLTILRVDGSLFFGAVEHVRDGIEAARATHRHHGDLLLVGTGINFIDVAGAELLAEEAKPTREAGGEFYLATLKRPVLKVLERGGFIASIRRESIYATEQEALRAVLKRLESSRYSEDAR